MSNDANTTTTKSRKPAYRLWLVEDREGQRPHWTALSGLWKTGKGNGLTAQLDRGIPPGSRIVILPVRKAGEH